MTPAEKLQAAIDKLESARADATAGVWLAWRSGLPGRERFGVEAGEEGTDIVWGVRRAPDAELIVTLHRTIDAQLAILRETLFQLEGSTARAGFIGNEFTLFVRLADAILGEYS